MDGGGEQSNLRRNAFEGISAVKEQATSWIDVEISVLVGMSHQTLQVNGALALCS